MRTAEIKRRFLAHFEANGHTVVPSAPLPAIEDPNLLFINAGMVQFVPYFTGQQTPPWTRATSVQKCIRTPDIEEVGITTRHGTFFQMNGNFSFGDYFKEKAIELAWDLMTRPQSQGGLGFDESKLYPSVYVDDDEAIGLWKRIAGLPDERIPRLGKSENFWSMGIPGPCGPCSEILLDLGPEFGEEGDFLNGDRYMELWNLVFMQNLRGEGTNKEDFEILGDLPAKNIDTGMGLERVAYMLQGVNNMFEIDEVRPLIDRASELTGKRYGASRPDDVRFRVIADHVRTGLMLIGDGVTPSNEGRGYVLRRILRRAIRAIRLLGFEDKALPELLPVARDCMSPSYPELSEDFERISSYAYGEEEAFRSTLRQGTTILDTAVKDTKASGGTLLPGAKAFELHDTYGFPIDLTLEMAAEQGLKVDEEGFRQLMAEQRRRAKADAQSRKTAHADMSAYRELLTAGGPTDWKAYETLNTESTVLGMLAEGSPIQVAKEGQLVEVVLDKTPFYAESGGQHADAGTITGASVSAEVVDVQRPIKGLVVHQVRVLKGELAVGTAVKADVDPEWRLGARQAHSGTHVVHAALREVLGPAALQSGSFNRPGYLRLDFSWRSKLSDESRSEVEEAANRAVRKDLPVAVKYMTLPEAREFGALALFGETYDETVRVVEIGGEWSRELCGGTHVQHAAQIGPVVITSEASVGSGQRRVEAVTGLEAFHYLARERDLVSQIADELGAPRAELPERISALMQRAKDAEKELANLRAKELRDSAATFAAQAKKIGDVAVAAVQAPDGTGGGDARKLATEIRGHLDPNKPGIAAVAATAGGKASLVVIVNKTGTAQGLSAQALVKGALSGRGGGNDEVAQGGGVPADQASALLQAVSAQVAGE
ncbi:alanine--tRNA ligase [Stackebrandtia nassauensis]|uniref:Alanine--tRNA ligase n=1 Tax=Stackebrandtia nassauensis (strain DSM 44728 / CIP 108903 / NRRL B-16338 / NBRC 102104 / LLR-40K-21) TaxID=446470 RepID=D3PYV0_STANL|nr:alanine--tRNA ligase [Stackebrandtia nassauensis]ADD43533.1 alanyl-tRNA synthetase [Stackebrandtia nassauensis DSM 44728]